MQFTVKLGLELTKIKFRNVYVFAFLIMFNLQLHIYLISSLQLGPFLSHQISWLSFNVPLTKSLDLIPQNITQLNIKMYKTAYFDNWKRKYFNTAVIFTSFILLQFLQHTFPVY